MHSHPESDSARQPAAARKMEWHFSTLLLLCATLTVAACSRETVEVTIPVGSSLRQASDSLRSSKLISFPALFRSYARLSRRDRRIQAGTFLVNRGSSWSTILDTLTRGKGIGSNVTIPEGYSLASIETLLATKLSLHPDSVKSATRDSSRRVQFNIPTGTLEGYLYPDTYSLPRGVSARAGVGAMLARFTAVWDSDWDAVLPQIKMSRHEVVTLASIIEREAILEHERAVISAVYHNRLKLGMPLQADPTVQYAKGQHAERVLLKDLEIDSPYNTYKYPGLPPGPIASPGAPSIRAALFPAPVRYLYFVAHPDGHHEFRNTYAEHLIAKQQLERIRKTIPPAK
jgi:UPF0755 protein